MKVAGNCQGHLMDAQGQLIEVGQRSEVGVDIQQTGSTGQPAGEGQSHGTDEGQGHVTGHEDPDHVIDMIPADEGRLQGQGHGTHPAGKGQGHQTGRSH